MAATKQPGRLRGRNRGTRPRPRPGLAPARRLPGTCSSRYAYHGFCWAPRSVRRRHEHRPLIRRRRETPRVRTGLPGLRGDPKWLRGGVCNTVFAAQVLAAQLRYVMSCQSSDERGARRSVPALPCLRTDTRVCHGWRRRDMDSEPGHQRPRIRTFSPNSGTR